MDPQLGQGYQVVGQILRKANHEEFHDFSRRAIF